MSDEPSTAPLIDYASDPVSGIKAFNQCICLADILSDSNNRLICADINSNLKVFKGKILQSETKLKLPPIAVSSFYAMDNISNSIIPFLAVAGGDSLFIYKNLKGTTKFVIPNLETNSVEQKIFHDLQNDKIDEKNALQLLKNLDTKLMRLKENPDMELEESDLNDPYSLKPLSNISIEILNIKPEGMQVQFLSTNKNSEQFSFVVSKNYISCWNSIPQTNSGDILTPSNWLIGTEVRLIIVLDIGQNKVLTKISIPEVPFIIESTGGYTGDYRIFVADRCNSIYIIGRNQKINTTITMPQCLVSMLLSNKNILVGTIGRQYQGYVFNGTKVFTIIQPSNITTMELYHRKSDNLYITLIGLKNEELHMYRERVLINIIKVKDSVFGMKTGKFEKNNDSWIIFTYKGAMHIKTFNQNISFNTWKYVDQKGSIQGELVIPKKTPMYVDLMQREQESAIEMQNNFQNDWLRLRYKALDTFVKMWKIGNAPQNYSSSSSMKISASLIGLGPNFKLNLIIDNVGNEPIFGCEWTLDFNRAIFMFDKENIQLGMIMPNISIKYSLTFRNISEMGNASIIKVIIVDKVKTAPLIQTTIKVPVSELEML